MKAIQKKRSGDIQEAVDRPEPRRLRGVTGDPIVSDRRMRVAPSAWRARFSTVFRLARLAPVVALGACVSISSTDGTRTGVIGPSSFGYMLPKAVVPIQLFEVDGEFIIKALAPRYLGDPQHFYIGSYRPNTFSSDTVTVTVSANGLLESVNVTADNKAGDVLVNLAKSYAAIRSGGLSQKESFLAGATPISVIDIDPDDPESLRAASDGMTSAARIRIRSGIQANCSASDEKKKELCRVYVRLRDGDLVVNLAAFASAIPRQAKVPDCSVGVCFRLPVPYRISAGFELGNDVTASSAIVALPNGGPIVATNFDRSLFVRRVTNAGFTNGVLTSLTVNKPSEAAAVALLPARIIAAFFQTITETFTTRQQAVVAEREYLSALEQLDQVRSRKESVRLGSSLLSVGIGASRPVLPAVVNQAGVQAPVENSSLAPMEEIAPDCFNPPCDP